MKKLIVLVVLFVLLGVITTAAAPIPPPTQSLQGNLRWQNASWCGVADYVPLQVMTNVYLTGKFKPTQGLFQGCQISATGFFYNVGQCRYFSVSTYKLTCPTTQ